jgi:hypothetical protein
VFFSKTDVTVHTPYEKTQCFNNIAVLDLFAFQSIEISDQRSQQHATGCTSKRDALVLLSLKTPKATSKNNLEGCQKYFKQRARPHRGKCGTVASGAKHATMGQILFKVKQVKMFATSDVKCLEAVLNSRNAIVHKNFKDNSFNDKNWRNPNFITKRESELLAILNEVIRINVAICQITDRQKQEYATMK